MTTSTQQNKESLDEWQWIPCGFDLKRSYKHKDEYFNLEPKAVLTLDEEELESHLNITMEKQFLHTKNIGYHWHKSWNLPIIKVSLDAEISVVKPILSNFKRFHLYDIGIGGLNKKKLTSLKSVFSSLKFQATSYNHNEAKFHLLISIYIEDEIKKVPLLLLSKISPPIFVDSRKSARDKKNFQNKNIKKFIDIFQPELLKKTFMKRECKGEENIDEEIKNNFYGLYNYFTAANIRDKEENFLMAIQTQICNYFCKKNQPEMKEKVFQLLIKADNQNEMPKIKKIMEFFESQKCKIFEIIIDAKYIEKNFQLLTNQNQLIETYYQSYQNLKNLSMHYLESNIDGQSDFNDSLLDQDSEFTCQQDQSNCYWEDNLSIHSKQKQQQQQQRNCSEIGNALNKKIKNNQGDEIQSRKFIYYCFQVPQKQDQQNMQGPIITEIQIYPPNPLSEKQKNFLDILEKETKNQHDFYQDQIVDKKVDSIENNQQGSKQEKGNNSILKSNLSKSEEKKMNNQQKKQKKKTPTNKIKIATPSNDNGKKYQLQNNQLQTVFNQNNASILDQLAGRNKNIGFTQYPKNNNNAHNQEAFSPMFQNQINQQEYSNQQLNIGNQQQQQQQQMQQNYPQYLINQLRNNQVNTSQNSLMNYNNTLQQLFQGTLGNMQQGPQRLPQSNIDNLFKF